MPAAKAFEIFYADGAIVAGTTKRQFEKAPEAGIQFVIVRGKDGSVVINKGADSYEFAGATKRGSWTDRENYDAIKASLITRSKLLVAQDRDPRDVRLSAIRKRYRTHRQFP